MNERESIIKMMKPINDPPFKCADRATQERQEKLGLDPRTANHAAAFDSAFMNCLILLSPDLTARLHLRFRMLMSKIVFQPGS